MDYQKFYDRLITNAVNRAPIIGYTEKHHIVPQCLNGSNDTSNIVKLTAREHFLAHAALAKIYTGTIHGYKLASAFNNMCQNGQNGQRYYNSKMFEIARKLFSLNHPCKQEHIKDKIRAGMELSKVLKEKICQCGCNELFTSYTNRKCISGHFIGEFRECACGCGGTFKTSIKSNRKYINKHNHKHQECLEKMGKGVSKSLKSYLEKLTSDELRDRIKKSWGSCDQIAKAKAISASKKGKKTNQQQIMGQRYALMSDEEFLMFLETKSKHASVQTRIINLRNKWINH